MKNRILLGAGALVVVAVPAVLGLWGNASFAESVPVRIPTQAVTTTAVPTPSPSESVDDHGGDVSRDDRTEPGDDRDEQGGTGPSSAPSPGSSPSPSPSVDDHGGDDGGSDDHGGDDNGGDDSGSDDHGGSDDRGGDDGGHGGGEDD